MPTPGSSAQWRANLWTRVEQMTNSVDTAFRQVSEFYHLSPYGMISSVDLSFTEGHC